MRDIGYWSPLTFGYCPVYKSSGTSSLQPVEQQRITRQQTEQALEVGMNTDAITFWIERWEGRRQHVGTDAAGRPTIGVGFDLDGPGAREKIEELGLSYDDVRAGRQDLTDDQMESLFDGDVDAALASARELLSNAEGPARSHGDIREWADSSVAAG